MMHTNRSARRWVLAATGLIAAVISAPAIAQEVTPATGAAADAAATEELETVVVKGLRKSLQSAVNKKRRAAQIVDAIDAEDAGKLPDNNVVEAISRVTGVQITRARGEGGEVMIRGQTDIQTTLNGSPNNTGVGRSASLNDIPAELLKSVQVYKTRTADQVEGGIAGTVNVDLRRPLDLNRGWTVAGSVRNVYGSVGDTESPYASALIAKRFDTSIGEMGFLLNLSYQENNYNENYVRSETPASFWCCGTQWDSVPGANDDEKRNNNISIYRAEYGAEYGKVRRPALNLSYQWRVNENLDFVLEASSFKAKENRSYSALNTRIKDSPGVLSDIVYLADGKTITSMTVTDPGIPGDGLPVGPSARDDYNESDNQRINFEAHWKNDRLRLDFTAYRDENSFDNEWYTQSMRLDGLTGFTIDTNSDKIPGGGPWVDYIGADVSDVDSYNLFEFENGKGFEESTENAFAVDATYRISDDKFFREFKAGARHTKRDVSRAYGYRFSRFGYDFATQTSRTVDLADFPGGAGYEAVTLDIDGFASPTWYRIGRKAILANFDAIRAYAADPDNRSSFGGSGDWDDEVVSTEQLNGSFVSEEETTAIYAQLAYGFNLGSFPVDGLLGVRTSKRTGFSQSAQYRNGALVPLDPIPASDIDTMPNASAVIHFTNKLQLRLAYTENVQRPSFQDQSDFVMFDTVNKNGWGGNPDLRPNREKNYDASLEYYFGRGGVLSAATYLKKPDNFTVWGRNSRLIDDDGNPATPDNLYQIDSPANGGPGEYQGFELNAQGFFEFLPGFWSNFGGQANFTYNTKAEIKYKFYNGALLTPEQIAETPGIFDAPNNSKKTYNLVLYYDTPQLSARVAFNHRDRYRGYLDGYAARGYSQYFEPTERLDAAINWTPIRQLTLSVEGTNLLEDESRVFYGKDKILPQGVRVPSRTIQVSARFRY